MKLIIGLFILLLVIAVGGKFVLDSYQGKGVSIPFVSTSSTANINNQTFKLYLTKEEKEKQIGLSGRNNMPQDYGMLFEFTNADYHAFWMRNMKFPIDIIFIRDNKIITVFHNVPPPKSEDENLVLYQPDEPSNKVLEINAGLAKKYNIKRGDTITISK